MVSSFPFGSACRRGKYITMSPYPFARLQRYRQHVVEPTAGALSFRVCTSYIINELRNELEGCAILLIGGLHVGLRSTHVLA